MNDDATKYVVNLNDAEINLVTIAKIKPRREPFSPRLDVTTILFRLK